ncbi:transcriptional regulator [Geobacillus subterraneus]|uniref:Transcriptional regulator n=2 Tax=Geobacillus TaxID=129337 RepID=A0ABN4NR22_9BACL|nr:MULTISPECIES: two-component system activity regulator YycH [Geobacillus]AMX84970.1 transcriptional regulator [Geobacillus subterraneus]KZS25134.1 transcriptional regulator [Geobacillus subterraneus]OXB85166.1 transcriptional regulator [Geobacillus uzenensis]QIZ66199.1 transcriptional regulator [Geobacillus subterraneus]WPZ18400.1 two-component system activity regulator YycH [Geobacillus subterraneus]
MYEAIKTVVLTVLVLISITLTFVLWTYHPKYDVLQNDEYIQHVSVSNTQVDTAMVVQPKQMLIHKNGVHYAVTKEEEKNEVLKEMKKWTLDDFENISSSVPSGKFLTFLNGKERLEIIYPDEIPIDIYRLIFTVEDKGLDDLSFDRILVPLEGDDEFLVYFMATDKQNIYKATASDASLAAIRRLAKEANHFPRYFAYPVSETKQLYLPESEVALSSLQYYTDELDVDKFKEALFSDPSFVKKDLIPFGEEYTDGSRLMGVDFLQRTLLYVNPAARASNISQTNPETHLIQKSIDFVNEHGGWTDLYHFARWSEEDRKVIFRLVVNGYPVFNEYGMSEIVETWGASDLMKYQRPLFRLEIADRNRTPKTLPSGRDIVKQLEKMKGFRKALVKDIAIGYELVKDPEREKVIRLEPAWFYLYGQTWKKVNVGEESRGGGTNGLE